ncbi:MAG TPA: twin-arginine translocase TatA/TatE family subunit [Rhodospirillaceae bacterium]|nr:MAG: preprotein translocase subunit SecA [Alphaproteobacteria bacterium GWF2_58_20]HAU29360.1 twin-arginine translocase TatA/TatE family subunit [Rhodospirillaceae bacterium]
MGLGFSELMIVLVIVLILFGAGKLPKVMSEMGRGVKGFREGMKEGDAPVKAEKNKKPSLPDDVVK